jgi:hypothetical protein
VVSHLVTLAVAHINRYDPISLHHMSFQRELGGVRREIRAVRSRSFRSSVCISLSTAPERLARIGARRFTHAPQNLIERIFRVGRTAFLLELRKTTFRAYRRSCRPPSPHRRKTRWGSRANLDDPHAPLQVKRAQIVATVAQLGTDQFGCPVRVKCYNPASMRGKAHSCRIYIF